ncbi:unnamed protein product [Spirodela intermedia]|uniref:Uncharacterized protein n=1 Tax=Spirodela intermedia TaxID=51605 RepID=A0A7I8JLW1_SPIIN|nr:unnamed protein product [Spirodela intermedia]CAA6670452.1 unnamed protein product [Spirodela intermedia]
MNDHPNDSCEDPLLTKNPPPPPPSCSDMSHVLDAIRDLSTRVTNIDTRQTSHHSPTLDEPPLTPFPSDPTPHATQFFNRACHHLDPYDHYNNPMIMIDKSIQADAPYFEGFRDLKDYLDWEFKLNSYFK